MPDLKLAKLPDRTPIKLSDHDHARLASGAAGICGVICERLRARGTRQPNSFRRC